MSTAVMEHGTEVPQETELPRDAGAQLLAIQLKEMTSSQAPTDA